MVMYSEKLFFMNFMFDMPGWWYYLLMTHLAKRNAFYLNQDRELFSKSKIQNVQIFPKI